MTIRFAAPPDALAPRVSARDIGKACGLPVNDNGGDRPSDAMLHAALRHFAEHGLAAVVVDRQPARLADVTRADARGEGIGRGGETDGHDGSRMGEPKS